MRWVPEDLVCAECRFDWSFPAYDAIAIVACCPDEYSAALAGAPRPADANWTSTAQATPLG